VSWTSGDTPAFRSFDGLIDEVGIWNEARSATQILADMLQWVPDEEGLLAYCTSTRVGIDDSRCLGQFPRRRLRNGHCGTQRMRSPSPDAEIHLLVRGYDDTLWHCNYDLTTVLSELGHSGCGILLSAPQWLHWRRQFDVLPSGLITRSTTSLGRVADRRPVAAGRRLAVQAAS